jgi:hypothetical protein
MLKIALTFLCRDEQAGIIQLLGRLDDCSAFDVWTYTRMLLARVFGFGCVLGFVFFLLAFGRIAQVLHRC